MKNITIDVGTTVRWTAQTGAPHTITSDGCGDPRAGACTFDSGLDQTISSTGQRTFYEFKFANPGVYSYYCRIHGAPGGVAQSGTITVAAPSGATGPAPVTALVLRPSASIVVYQPKEGATVVGDKVTVNLAVNGAQLRAPVNGQTNPNYGHFNLILDATNPDLADAIGGPTVTRANTNTATIENVKPGPHTLIAVWTYDNNVPPQPPITYTVKFTTVAAPDGGAAAAAPPAPGAPTSFRPPATGDGGLLGRGGGNSTNLYLASGMLLLAALGLGYRMRDRA
jgi:hypothetical protein